jgi:outer membrane immunogenic protein
MKTMLRVAAAIAALAVVTPAGAADLPVPDKAPPAPAPAAGYWSGFYIGLNGGGAFGHADSTGNNALGGAPTASFTGSYNVGGFFAGGQFGLNYQFPSNIVLGFEANIDGSDIKGSTAFCINASNCQTTNYLLWTISTLDARLGYAVGNVLFYGTGGGVGGNIRTHSTLTASTVAPGLVGFVAGDSAEPMGWTAGAGIEWGFMPNWTLKVEYKHLAFINDTLQTYNYGLIGGVTPFVGQAFPKASIDTARIGVNYLFHWGDNATFAR